MSSSVKAPNRRFHRQDPSVGRSSDTVAPFEEASARQEQVSSEYQSTPGRNPDMTLTRENSGKTTEVATLPTRNLVRSGQSSNPVVGIKQALARTDPNKRSNRIGELLVELGQLTPKEVRHILRRQRSGELEPFGRIASDLGMSSPRDIKRALTIQKQRSGPLNPHTCWENQAICTLNDRQSASAEAIRTLRARLMINQDDDTSRPIAVVSPERGEGRSYIAANLAVAYAQAGRRTLLIDADLRNPTQHSIFGINNERGFSTLAVNRKKEDDDHPVFNIIDNLYLVPAGPKTTSPQELLCRDYTGEWLDVIMGFFDVVIIDTPAANHFADAELLAAWAGHAIVVTRRHKSRTADTTKMIKRMKGADTHIRGIVINE